jgi:hypothetical protein
MQKPTKAKHIGLGQAPRICNLPSDQRLKLIAEGLPIILGSARSLMAASEALSAFPREAAILKQHASEECAKILILLDVIRCPAKLLSSRIGKMMKWFYDHLARLIYADAQTWNAYSLKELQGYVDQERRSHYLEGEYSEYILPNMVLYDRESALYADLMSDESGTLAWHAPSAGFDTVRFDLDLMGMNDVPKGYPIVDALDAAGGLTSKGLEIIHTVWGAVPFSADVDWHLVDELRKETVNRFNAAGVVTDRATDDHAQILYRRWQVPMYEVDFSKVEVDLAALLKARELDNGFD